MQSLQVDGTPLSNPHMRRQFTAIAYSYWSLYIPLTFLSVSEGDRFTALTANRDRDAQIAASISRIPPRCRCVRLIHAACASRSAHSYKTPLGEKSFTTIFALKKFSSGG